MLTIFGPHILECRFCCSPYYEYFADDYDDDDDGNLIKELLKFYVSYICVSNVCAFSFLTLLLLLLLFHCCLFVDHKTLIA